MPGTLGRALRPEEGDDLVARNRAAASRGEDGEEGKSKSLSRAPAHHGARTAYGRVT
jgi:hypothetical protein